MKLGKNTIHSAQEEIKLLNGTIVAEQNRRQAIIREGGEDFIAFRVKSCDDQMAALRDRIRQLEEQKAKYLASPSNVRGLLIESLQTERNAKNRIRVIKNQNKLLRVYAEACKMCRKLKLGTPSSIQEAIELLKKAGA